MGSGRETDSTIFSIKIRVVNVARQEINIIMRYTEFLSEKILNLHTVDEKMRYAEPVWDMLLRSYQKIGGIKSAVSVEDLANEPGYWKILRRGDRITAVVVYKKIAKTHNFNINKKFKFGKNSRVKSSFGKSVRVKRTNVKRTNVKLKQIDSEIKFLKFNTFD